MLIGASPTSAGATTTFLGWSFGHLSPSTSITGLDQSRYDHTMNISSGRTCGFAFTLAANTVYQTQYIYITGHPTGTTWLTFGTDHQCTGHEWWFGGYGQSNTFHPLFTRAISTGTQHSFFLYADMSGGTQYWNWHVGSTSLYGPWAKSWKGDHVTAGLQSYYSGLFVVYHTYALYYQVNDTGTWNSWSGTTKFTSGSPMCYRKTTTTVIYVGEYTSC